MERNFYGTSLIAIWHAFWGSVLILLGILITFNIQDTVFVSKGAPTELTTDAVIVGLATLLYGAAIIGVALGLWYAKSWAWWAAAIVGSIVLVADVVNFARIATALSMLPSGTSEFPRRLANWPILMWTQQLTFLGSKQTELFITAWPVLFHLVVSFPILLYLVSPQVRDLFGVTGGQGSARMPAAGYVEQTRVREPLPPPPAPRDERTFVRRDAPAKLGYLIVQNGPLAGESLPLREVTAIGRSRKGNDIVLDDKAVSRQHAIVRLENGRFLFQDRGSSNRSYLVTDGRSQEIPGRYPLVDGDQVMIGETRLLFRDGHPGS